MSDRKLTDWMTPCRYFKPDQPLTLDQLHQYDDNAHRGQELQGHL